MGKLTSIQGGMAALKKQIDGNNEKSFASLSNEIRVLGNAVQVVLSALNNRDSADQLNQSSSKDLTAALNVMAAELKGLTGIPERLASIESSVSKEISIPDNSDAFQGVQDAIKGIHIPVAEAVDLTSVNDMLTALLDKEVAPVVIPKGKDKHIFTIERDGENLITRVVVT